MSHGYSESLEILIAQIGRRVRGLIEIKLLVQEQARTSKRQDPRLARIVKALLNQRLE